MPKNIESIYEGLLAYCPNLKSVTIHEKVTYIDTHAFSQNKVLESVICLSQTPPVLYDYYEEDENPFGWVTKDSVTLYVPKGTVAAYRKTSWSMFKNIVETAETEIEPISITPEDGSTLSSLTTIDLAFDEPITVANNNLYTVRHKHELKGPWVSIT